MPKDEKPKDDVKDEKPEETADEPVEEKTKGEIRAEQKEAALKEAEDLDKELKALAKAKYGELLSAAYEMATLDVNNATRSRIDSVQGRLRIELKKAFPKLFV